MRKLANRRWLACLAVILALGAGGLTSSLALDPQQPKPLQGITKPSDERILSYAHPGVIADVKVKEGDSVTEGQLVAQLDDTAEQSALAAAKAEADDDTESLASKAMQAKEEADLAELKRPASNGGTVGSPFEIRDKVLAIDIDKARIAMADMKQHIAQLKYEQNKVDVERFKIKSPMDGIATKVFLKKGESADGSNMRAMRIVKIDPMWVEVPVPISQARTLKKEDPANIAFSDNRTMQGKVFYKPETGDSASETIMVRIEVPNPQHQPTGENVFVTFPSTRVSASR